MKPNPAFKELNAKRGRPRNTIPTEPVYLRLPETMLRQIDTVLAMGEYRSVQEYIMHCIREDLRER